MRAVVEWMERPVNRRTYVSVGISLMLLKYVVDAVVIYWATGITWTPQDYFLPLVSFTSRKVAQFPSGLNVLLLAWTLPFIFIGMTMSVRRALDANISPWIVVAFFLPVLNYVMMIVLAIAPTSRVVWMADARATEADVVATRTTQGAIIAGALVGAAVGFGLVAFGVLGLRIYGLTLFLVVPLLIGAVSAVAAGMVAPVQFPQAAWAGVVALGVVAGTLILLALEGAVCVVMAVPIAVPLQLLGSFLGYLPFHRRPLPPSVTGMSMFILIAPVGLTIDSLLPPPSTRIVLTAIEIDAPPTQVWNHVVSFSDIKTPPTWLFRTGLAYPLRARIDGTGVGAIRHCEFTTGAFVEPITTWDPPRVLAFDVTTQPAPLVEWSPYSQVYAPHIEGFFSTSHGEFRLIALDGGRTRLEGRTWYTLRMQPAMYWNTIADAILHRIHERVLEEVRMRAETDVRSARP